MGCLEEKKIQQISSDLLKKMEMHNYILARTFLMRFISLCTINKILIKKECLSPEITALQVNSDSAGRFFPLSRWSSLHSVQGSCSAECSQFLISIKYVCVMVCAFSQNIYRLRLLAQPLTGIFWGYEMVEAKCRHLNPPIQSATEKN